MDINAAFQTAIQYQQANNLKKAKSIYDDILKVQPDNIDVLYLLGTVNHQLRNYDSALECFKKALFLEQDKPTRFNPFYLMASIFHTKWNLNEAVTYYQKTLENLPNNAEVLKPLSIVYAKLKKYDLAIQPLRILLQINPNDAYLNLALALALKEQGLIDESIKYFNKTIELNPDDPLPYKYLGMVFKEIKQINKAETYEKKYEEALQKLKVFFLAGNKRSGSSFIVKLLNLHPKMFMSHESDIIWILNNFHANKPFIPYPLDDPHGMQHTLDTCGHFLNEANSPKENYFTIQQCLMREGFNLLLPPMSKTDLIWIGDKKPVQYSDPSLVEFIFDIFSEPRFIHLVRHPFAVAKSAKLFDGDGGYIWRNMELEEIVEMWTKYEKWILDLKTKHPTCVLDVTYEDLCRDTKNEVSRIYEFFKLDFDENLLLEAASLLKYKPKQIPKISCSEETVSVMAKYGYEPISL
jgi:tetratricopeptide (TPR) repeat protein